MKQGRLLTDERFRNEMRRQIQQIIDNQPGLLVSVDENDEYKIIYLEGFNRYIIINEFGTIYETANGWGYKTLLSAQKAAQYMAMRSERVKSRQTHKRHRGPDSYDIDMEMAECYYGYNEADFY